VQSLFSPLAIPIRPPLRVSNLRRNLEALLSPRIKVSARKFGKLAPLKLLAVPEIDDKENFQESFHVQDLRPPYQQVVGVHLWFLRGITPAVAIPGS
jgi:hypothetical protein